MLCRRKFGKSKPLEPFRITSPPNRNAVEQLLTLQEVITQVEALIQDGNIFLLKIRALLFAVLPQVCILYIFPWAFVIWLCLFPSSSSPESTWEEIGIFYFLTPFFGCANLFVYLFVSFSICYFFSGNDGTRESFLALIFCWLLYVAPTCPYMSTPA